MRFHMGVSFRLKSLKKFIIPLIVGILAYLFSSGILTVKAAEQEPIIINTTNVQDLEICGRPITDYINYFEQYTSDKYRFVLSSSQDFDKFTFWFIPNYFDNINYSIISYDGTTSSYGKWISYTNVAQSDSNYINRYEFYLQIASVSQCENVSFLDNVNAQSEFLDLMENYYNFRDNPYTQDFPSIKSTELGLISWPIGKLWTYRNNKMVSDVGDSYEGYMWNILYSNTPIYYDTTISTWYDSWGQDWEILPVIYNGKELTNNEEIDFNYFPPRSFGKYGIINDIFLYTRVQDLGNINITLSYESIVNDFNQSTLTFTMGGQTQVLANDNFHYLTTFNNIDTSSCTYTYSITNSQINISNVVCPSTVTTGYDRVSLKFHLNTNDYTLQNNEVLLLPITEFNQNRTSSSLWVNYDNTSNDFYYPIIDTSDFSNLSINSEQKFFISSNNSFTDYIKIKSGFNKTYIAPFKVNPFERLGDNYEYYNNNNQLIQIGTTINRGIMLLFNDGGQTQVSSLRFFFNKGNYIFRTTNYDFYYYSNGVIDNSSIDTDDIIPQNDNNEYNSIDSYFNIVTNYIDGISTDMVNFGDIVQQVYDTIPSFISSFIVVLYILGNAYIVYRLINRR